MNVTQWRRRANLVILTILSITLTVPMPMYALEDVPEAPSATTADGHLNSDDDITTESVAVGIDNTEAPDNKAVASQKTVDTTAISSIASEQALETQLSGTSPQLALGEIELIPEVATALQISKFQTGSAVASANEFIELYNPSVTTVSLEGWQLQYLKANFEDATTATPPTRVVKEFYAEDTISGQSTLLLAHDSMQNQFAGLNVTIFNSNPASGALAKTGGSLRLVRGDAVIDLVGWGAAKQYETESTIADDAHVWQRCMADGSLRDTDNNALDFAVYSQAIYGMMLACASPIEPDEEVPGNACEGLVVAEVGANLDEQFVELHNMSDGTLELQGCRIQTNRSKTREYTFGKQQLAAGARTVVWIADTDLLLTKTTTGTVYLLDEAEREISSVSYADLDESTSWANIGGTWKQTYAMTPGDRNEWQQYEACSEGYYRNETTGRCNRNQQSTTLTPCAAGQYRNLETNRCRSTATVANTLTPCAPGQYRNPATNRCKKLVTAASSLAACGSGEYRNPETNRCKKLASTTSSLKPCEPGYARNPETNRCRKTAVAGASAPLVDFPVQEVKDGTKAFVGWWALGGLLILGAGYATWEWRHEIATATRTLRTKITNSKKG